MNLVEILKFSEEYLKKYSFSKPRLEAEKLVSYVLNLDRIALYIHYERELSEDEKTSIKQYLKFGAYIKKMYISQIMLKVFLSLKKMRNFYIQGCILKEIWFIKMIKEHLK